MYKGIIWSAAVIALFTFGACGGGGGGETTKLFGTTLGNSTLGNSVLLLLSPEDGSFISTIGSTGHYINGLAYDAVSDKLYATTSFRDPIFSYGLIELDMETATATTIGYAGIDIQTPTVNSSGEIYAWSENQEQGGGDDLISVDPTTGVATTLGDSGLSTGGHGLAFDMNDDLYFVNFMVEIYTIDAASGAATFFTDPTPLDIHVGGGDNNDLAHHGDFHPETNYYWGIGGAYPWEWATVPTRKFLVIDMNTPAVIDSTLQTVDHLHAITFYRH